ncbi:MAG: energy transducer TonB [Alphaproteobacteria bacterium]|nr:energy transducer TonB [Alphaproteobacteria bacterium]
MRRRIVKLSTVVSFSLAIASGGLLYLISQRVHEAESVLSRLEGQLDREEEAIRVLHAEWDYLNHPARLEQLARQYLEMEAPETNRILAGVTDLPEPFIPALPPQKPAYRPVIEIRSVSAQRRAEPSAPIASPFPPPTVSGASSHDDQFNALLQNLGSHGEGG